MLSGCIKEQPGDEEPRQGGKTCPFSVSVETGPLTRASFDGSAIDSGSYVFASGDKLYVTGGEGNISGILDITTGVGEGTANFSGELIIGEGYSPGTDTNLTFTLVGSAQSGSFFTITDGKVTGVNYPSNISYDHSSIAELVQNYSYFTTTVKYGVHRFTLNQQTVFLNFRIERLASDFIGSPSTVQVDIKSADGESTLRSVTDVPVGGSSIVAIMSFTTVFPAGDGLQGAQIIVNNGSGVHCTPDFAAGLTLLANNYYSVDRSTLEPFTIEAPSDGVGTEITFKYTPVQYRKYSGGSWTDWADYSSKITLSAGEKLSFRGQRTDYNNSGGSNPLFTTTNPVYIYGDIMSLMCDTEWHRKYSVGENAFQQAFKGRAVNIPADKDLILSAETLGTSCYKNMFNGCTQLTKAPVLPATTSTSSCYESMFQGCTALVTPPSSIPLSTIADNACKKMFSGCTRLTSAPELSFTTVGESGCAEMFYNCTSLVTPPSSLPGETLGLAAYNKMFYNCTALTSIPDFPHDPDVTYSFTDATEVNVTANDNGVCNQMFFNCTSLTTLAGKQLFNSTSPLGKGCFQDMFSTCTNLGTQDGIVPDNFLPATTLAESCYRGMFQSTAITNAPDLLAENLVSNCYRYMFNNCKKIEYIKCLSSVAGSTDFTQNWLANAKNSNTCHFYYRKGVTWNKNNAHGIPDKWIQHEVEVEP